MAVDRHYLLDLLARVKKFDSNREWESLSANEKNLLEEFAAYYGSEAGIDTATGYDLLVKLKDPKASHDLLAIIQSLESIESSFDEVTAGTLPPEILAEYQEYLKQVKQRAATPGVISPQMSLAETIKKAQYFYQLRLKAEAARAAHHAVINPNLDPVANAAKISTIVATEVKENNDLVSAVVRQQKDPVEVITKPVTNISTLYVEEVAASLKISLPEAQKNEAILTLAQFVYSGGVEELVDPLAADPNQALTPGKIDTASRNLVGATIVILRETVSPAVLSTANTPYEQARGELQSFFQSETTPAAPIEKEIAPTLSTTATNQIENISASILAKSYLTTESLQAASQNVYQVQLKFASASLPRYSSIDLPIITDAEIGTIIRAYQHDHPGDLITPNLIQTYNVQKTISAIKTADPSDKNHLSSIKAYHQGVHLDVVRAMAHAQPGSELDKLVQEKPGLISRLIKIVQPLENSHLGQSGEISTPVPTRQTPPSNPIQRLYNSTFGAASRGLGKIVDTVSSRNPAVGKIMNVVKSPLQSALRPIFAWAGRQAGVQAARQFIQNVAAKAIGKVASEGVKKMAQTLISKGLTEGLKALVIRGAAAIGIDIAVGATGVGLPLAVIMLAIQIATIAIGMAADFIQKNSKDIGEQVVGAAFMFSTAVGGFFSGMVAVAVATGMTLIIITGISMLLGAVMYIAINNIAPIISSIAQLESGIGVQQGILPSLRYPAYTGAIIPGCSLTWPVPPGAFFLQGPHGTFSHRTIEAVDIYIPIGTTITSISSGVVEKAGWGNAYGNWIWIRSTTEDGKSYSVIYSHLTEIGVVVGDPVGVGSPIALSGATSSVPAYRNPHLHLEYRGIAYNSCPAGGVQIPEGCAGYRPTAPGACLINNKPIYTN